MLQIENNGYLEEDILDALAARPGNIKYERKYEILNEDNQVLRETTNITAGSIRGDDDAAIKTVINFTLVEGEAMYDSTRLLSEVDYAEVVSDTFPLIDLALNETSGTTAEDASAGGYDGTYNGSISLNQASILPGDPDRACPLFDGSNDYVSIAHNSAFNGSRLTVWAWIKTVETSFAIYSRDDGSSARHSELRIDSSGNLQATLRFTTPATGTYTAQAIVNDGELHFVCLVYDGSYVTLDVDSSQVLKTAETRTLASPSAAINIGRSLAANSYFSGYIQAFAYFARAVGSAERRIIYQRGIADFAEMDFHRDRLRVTTYLKMQTAGDDGSYLSGWYDGTFILGQARKNSAITTPSFEVAGFDKTWILSEDAVDAEYSVIAGTNYVTAINTILAATGFSSTEYSIAATSEVLPSARSWIVGTTKLAIVNDLLEAIHYRQLYADGNGVLRSEPYVLPESRTADDALIANAQSVISPERIEEDNIDSIPNKVVLVRTNSKGDTLRGIATNTNVSSPTSYPRRGRRWKVLIDPNVDAVDQTAIDGLAAKRLTDESNKAFKMLKIKVPHRPFYALQDVVTLTIPSSGITAKNHFLKRFNKSLDGKTTELEFYRIISVAA